MKFSIESLQERDELKKQFTRREMRSPDKTIDLFFIYIYNLCVRKGKMTTKGDARVQSVFKKKF